MQDIFPMGFWGTQSIDDVPLCDVADWAACGMTLTVAPHYAPDPTRKEKLLALLDECHKYGIRLILSDSRATWRGAAEDPDGYRARFAEAVADFGSHPAVFGFHLGDEPRKDSFADIEAAARIQRELAPQLSPYLNHFPGWTGHLSLWGCQNFTEWTHDVLPRLGVPLISFDNYTQMNPYGDGKGVDDYYTSLRVYAEAAAVQNIPFWSIVLSVGHFRYRCPNEDDIRWQLYTSVIHGAKGIIWFYYRMMRSHINYRNAPVNELGEKTETWTWLSRQLRLFHKTYGPLMMRLTHRGSWHLGRAYGGWPMWQGDVYPMVHDFISNHGLYGVFSRFTDDDGREYVAILNNDQRESGMFHLVFDPAVKRLWRICFGGVEHDVATDHWDADYRIDGDHIVSGTWLAPGQMEIYRLEIEQDKTPGEYDNSGNAE